MNRQKPGTVLILGATSGIGRHIAAGFARRGYDLYLTGRDLGEVGRLARDLEIRHGVTATADCLDICDFESHEGFFHRALKGSHGALAGTVIAVGLLGDPDTSVRDSRAAHSILDVNYTGPVSILTFIASHLEREGRGFIVGIGSVAGDRGRGSNYVYGSAKGGFALYLQGLRNRLHPKGIQVLTVKPGFVDTGMIYHLPSGFPPKATPEQVGESIVRAVERKRDVIYVPWFWRWILLVIRLIPEPIFKRTKL